jgi:hypothetical protein
MGPPRVPRRFAPGGGGGGRRTQASEVIFVPHHVFGPIGNTIPALQERGIVFLGCHNAIWELAASLITRGTNPDHVSNEEIAAELTNHLIDDVVLTPSIVATIPELQQTGFHYIA